jgi:hypothetical protein
MKKVSSILTQRRQLANAKPLPFILTDLYPPSRLPSSPSTSFTYHPDPVDATAPPKSLLQGVGKHIRTFALAFHHFPEKEAKEVLQAGMIESDAFWYVSSRVVSGEQLKRTDPKGLELTTDHLDFGLDVQHIRDARIQPRLMAHHHLDGSSHSSADSRYSTQPL